MLHPRNWFRSSVAMFGVAAMALSVGCAEPGESLEDCAEKCDSLGFTWAGADEVSDRSSDSPTAPRFAIALDGTTMAIWEREVFGDYRVWTSILDPSTGQWSDAREASDRSSDSPTDPQLAISDDGTAMAVWEREVFNDYRVWTSVYDPATGQWGDPREASDRSSDSPTAPQIAIAPDNTAMVIWEREVFDDYRVWTSVFDPSTGQWSDAREASDRSSGSSTDPQLAISDDGTAMAVWQREVFDDYRVWTSVYDPATGLWDDPREASDRSSDSPTAPKIAIGVDGAALVIWEREVFDDYRVWTSAFDPATGQWGDPREASDRSSDSPTDPQLAIADDGTAIVIWEREVFDDYRVWTSVLDPTSGQWGDAREASDRSSDSPTAPKIAIGVDGTALVIWEREVFDDYRVWTSVLDPATGQWGGAREASDRSSDSPTNPQLAIADDGSALVIWEREVFGDFRVWSARSDGLFP